VRHRTDQCRATAYAPSIEHRASSIEHRASSIEHRASSIEHRASCIPAPSVSNPAGAPRGKQYRTGESQDLPLADIAPMALDEAAIEAARHSLDRGGLTPHHGAWRKGIVKLLDDSLATELVCVLRYKRHHFTAVGLASPKIAEEFMVHANEESAHADRLAQRIVQLGGEPDFSPETLIGRSHAAYDDSAGLIARRRK
jgi:bacterioferritin